MCYRSNMKHGNRSGRVGRTDVEIAFWIWRRRKGQWNIRSETGLPETDNRTTKERRAFGEMNCAEGRSLAERSPVKEIRRRQKWTSYTESVNGINNSSKGKNRKTRRRKNQKPNNCNDYYCSIYAKKDAVKTDGIEIHGLPLKSSKVIKWMAGG